jgi:hypothetical protein
LSTRWDAVDQDVDDLRRSQIVKEEMHRWVEDIMRSWEEGEGFRRRRRTSWEKKEEGRSGSGVGEEVGIEGCRYGLQTQWAMTSCCYYLFDEAAGSDERFGRALREARTPRLSSGFARGSKDNDSSIASERPDGYDTASLT